MFAFSNKLGIGLVVASAVILWSTGGSVVAQQQDADKIRGQCIDEVMKQWPDPDPSFQRQRVQLYINCMTKHGLKP